MSSELRGTGISAIEVSGIGQTGFWLLVDDAEYLVPFDDYPVFRKATVEQVFEVQRLAPDHFHWPAIDADIELEALEHPERYPLVWKD